MIVTYIEGGEPEQRELKDFELGTVMKFVGLTDQELADAVTLRRKGSDDCTDIVFTVNDIHQMYTIYDGDGATCYLIANL